MNQARLLRRFAHACVCAHAFVSLSTRVWGGSRLALGWTPCAGASWHSAGRCGARCAAHRDGDARDAAQVPVSEGPCDGFARSAFFHSIFLWGAVLLSSNVYFFFKFWILDIRYIYMYI